MARAGELMDHKITPEGEIVEPSEARCVRGAVIGLGDQFAGCTLGEEGKIFQGRTDGDAASPSECGHLRSWIESSECPCDARGEHVQMAEALCGVLCDPMFDGATIDRHGRVFAIPPPHAVRTGLCAFFCAPGAEARECRVSSELPDSWSVEVDLRPLDAGPPPPDGDRSRYRQVKTADELRIWICNVAGRVAWRGGLPGPRGLPARLRAAMPIEVLRQTLDVGGPGADGGAWGAAEDDAPKQGEAEQRRYWRKRGSDLLPYMRRVYDTKLALQLPSQAPMNVAHAERTRESAFDARLKACLRAAYEAVPGSMPLDELQLCGLKLQLCGLMSSVLAADSSTLVESLFPPRFGGNDIAVVAPTALFAAAQFLLPPPVLARLDESQFFPKKAGRLRGKADSSEPADEKPEVAAAEEREEEKEVEVVGSASQRTTALELLLGAIVRSKEGKKMNQVLIRGSHKNGLPRGRVFLKLSTAFLPASMGCVVDDAAAITTAGEGGGGENGGLTIDAAKFLDALIYIAGEMAMSGRSLLRHRAACGDHGGGALQKLLHALEPEAAVLPARAASWLPMLEAIARLVDIAAATAAGGPPPPFEAVATALIVLGCEVLAPHAGGGGGGGGGGRMAATRMAERRAATMELVQELDRIIRAKNSADAAVAAAAAAIAITSETPTRTVSASAASAASAARAGVATASSANLAPLVKQVVAAVAQAADDAAAGAPMKAVAKMKQAVEDAKKHGPAVWAAAARAAVDRTYCLAATAALEASGLSALEIALLHAGASWCTALLQILRDRRIDEAHLTTTLEALIDCDAALRAAAKAAATAAGATASEPTVEDGSIPAPAGGGVAAGALAVAGGAMDGALSLPLPKGRLVENARVLCEALTSIAEGNVEGLLPLADLLGVDAETQHAMKEAAALARRFQPLAAQLRGGGGLGSLDVRSLLAQGDGLVTSRQLFHCFDADGSGVIEFEEFRRLFAHLGVPLTAQQIQDLFATADAGGSGVIDAGEFENCMQRLGTLVLATVQRTLLVDTQTLVLIFGALVLMLALVICFIFMGIRAFTSGTSNFNSVVNSLLPMLAGGGMLAKGGYDIELGQITQYINDALKVIQHH